MRAQRKIISKIENLKAAAYDLRHNVHTCGMVRMRTRVPDAFDYTATPATSIRHLIENSGIDIENSVFVDMGSGKGRCLLVAAEYPFRGVFGVEIGDDLHRIAEENIRSYRGRRRCNEIRSIHTDARNFRFADTPALIHFFNPFREAVMDRVVENICASSAMMTMGCQYGLVAKESIRRNSRIEIFKRTPYFEIYRTCPAVEETAALGGWRELEFFRM